jgi:nitrite reductase (NO-forming)
VEVAPGVKQQMWSFQGKVPGPALRGKVGDLFTITLVNDRKNKLGHSIDFHASKVAWNDEMRTINPGEQLVYQFKAKHAGIYMYHCGTAPTLHHIGNGMYGAIVVDPPGLAAVDHEYLLVQSELYLGPQGQPGSLRKMQNEGWDAVVFNGYATQYKFRPIRVEPGQRVRVWVLDAGPSENSAFHIVGTVFDTVYKEGEYRLRPGAGRGAGPPARPGRLRRVQLRRARPVPDRDPQVRQRRQGRPRAVPGRRGQGHRRRPLNASWEFMLHGRVPLRSPAGDRMRTGCRSGRGPRPR